MTFSVAEGNSQGFLVFSILALFTEEQKQPQANLSMLALYTEVRYVAIVLALITGVISGCAAEEASKAADILQDTTAEDLPSNSNTERSQDVEEPDSVAIPLRTPDGGVARFAFRSGKVVMHYSGDLKGIRQLTFDAYGLNEHKLDSAVPASTGLPIVPTQTLSILTPEYYGVIDLRAQSGEKAVNRAYQHYLAMPEIKTTPYGEISLQRSGGERLPDTVLLGKYYCRVYQQARQRYTHTIWVWGGVPIREKLTVANNAAGSYVLEPVKIETDIDVPQSQFEFPEGYSIKEVTPPPIQ